VKRAGQDVVSVLDYAGENNMGVFPLQNTPVVLSVVFSATKQNAVLRTNGCAEITVGNVAHAATVLAMGYRASDPANGATRHLDGAIAELAVFDTELNVTEIAKWELTLGAKYGIKNSSGSACPDNGQQFVLGSADATTSGPIHIVVNRSSPHAPPPLPASDDAAAAAFAAAFERKQQMGSRVVSETPSVFLDAGMSAAAAAIDGLFRDSPPVYLHGAMAWDVALVGWRSQYGATCWGWTENVAAEGRCVVRTLHCGFCSRACTH
jgi:hypothetical protein